MGVLAGAVDENRGPHLTSVLLIPPSERLRCTDFDPGPLARPVSARRESSRPSLPFINRRSDESLLSKRGVVCLPFSMYSVTCEASASSQHTVGSWGLSPQSLVFSLSLSYRLIPWAGCSRLCLMARIGLLASTKSQ